MPDPDEDHPERELAAALLVEPPQVPQIDLVKPGQIGFDQIGLRAEDAEEGSQFPDV